MKKILKQIGLLLLVAPMCVACTNDLIDEGVNGGTNGELSEDVVVLSGVVDESRVMYEHPDGGRPFVTNWKTSDKVGIVVYDNTAKTVFKYRHEYRPQSEGTTTVLAPAPGVNGVTWSSMASYAQSKGGYDYTFYAVHPYSTAIQHYEIPYSVPTEQTQARINDGGHIAPTDLMVAKVTLTEEPANRSVNLTFKHILSVLELQLTSQNGSVRVDKFVFEFEDTAEVASVESGMYNPSNGIFYSLTGSKTINPSNRIVLSLAEPAEITPASNHQVFMQIMPGHSGKRFTITAYNGATVVGTINKKFNSALPAGAQAQLPMVLEGSGVNYGGAMTEVWVKDLASIAGVTPTKVSGLAVSGNNLVLNQVGSTSPVYLNRLTGERLGTMNISSIGTVNNAIPFHATSDDSGNILFCNRTNVDSGGSTFKIWKSKGVGEQPSLLLSCPVSSSAQRYGWHLSVQGSVDGDALITTPIHNSTTGEAKFARWQVKGGVLVSQTPTIVAMPLSASNGWKWSNGDIVYAEGNNPESDYFVASHISDATHGRKLFWVDGIKNSTVVATAPGENTANTVMTSVDYAKCGGVSYVAYNFVNTFPYSVATSNAVMLYRLGNDSFAMPIYVCQPNSLRGSVATSDTSAAYALSDVVLHEDGDVLWLYAMFADGKVGCYKMSASVQEPATTQIANVNLSIGKFYKSSVAPMDGYTDLYPCLDYSTGVKLTDGEVASSSSNAALGVGWNSNVDVVVDLGRKRTIGTVKLHAITGQVSSYNFSLPSSVKVCGSADNKSWSTPVALTFNTQTGWATVQSTVANCRYLKFTINAPSGGRMLVDEIEAWGEYKNEMKYVPKNGAYHGAFNNSTSFSGEEGNSSCPLDLFEERVGKQISMILWYQGATGPTRNYAEIMNIRKTYSGKNYDGKYRLFMYGWEPKYSSADLMTGVMDEYYDTYFKEVREVQKGDDDCGPAWFRPGNEMNSNWVTWGNDAPNYVKYWRRMYNIAEQVGLTDYNVFVWSSADISFGKHTMKEYYPGDQYCDWIGTSCYFSSSVAYGYPSYLMNETESMSANKPVMISEGGYGSDACNNSLWVQEWFGLKTSHPRVKAVVWENHNSGTNERRIHLDPEALALYKQLVKDNYWLDQVPAEVLDEMAVRKSRQNLGVW